jgi:hypothetical protein
MRTRTTLAAAVLAAGALLGWLPASGRIDAPLAFGQETTKPNIVFVLMDNLGYGEVGSYGGGMLRGAPTSRIDKLASEGTRLLNFNIEAQCTPSRSAIMTGRFSIRSGTPDPLHAAKATTSQGDEAMTTRPTLAAATLLATNALRGCLAWRRTI